MLLLNLYILSTLYTNTMGLIIIAKCKPFVKQMIESNGYIVKEKDDTEFVIDIMLNILKFLVLALYLYEALKFNSKDFNVQKIIQEKERKGEIEKNPSQSAILDESIFRDERKPISLSMGRYEKPTFYKAHSGMYTKDRYPNTDDIDMDFWEEEMDISSDLKEKVEMPNTYVKSDPLNEYLASMSPEDIEDMQRKLSEIEKMKKEHTRLLNIDDSNR